MIVIDALVTALRNRGIEVIEQPQASTNTNAHLELWLEGFSVGGEKRDNNPLSYETLAFKADVVSSGVARQFVGRLRKILRAMMRLGESRLIIPLQVPNPEQPGETRTKNLTASFEKISPGVFEYESDESPMPARFRETWRITITYPADIVPNEED
jgi:hypothetical protein